MDHGNNMTTEQQNITDKRTITTLDYREAMESGHMAARIVLFCHQAKFILLIQPYSINKCEQM